MAISIGDQPNIDKSNLTAYPNGQILDNTGPGTGTPIICVTASDIWMFFDKAMRHAQLPFNAEFDNETNGYQFVQACAALPSKSDFVLPLTSTASVLQIPTALQILQLNEKLICKAGSDFASEATIKGTGPTALAVTFTSPYKTGDYVMLVRTSGGVQLIRMVTADNINLVVSENAYLKAANNAAEDAGTSVALATTPAGGKYIFTKRVTDPTAAIPYLATDSTPGLMSAADKTALDGFTSPIKNIGSFGNVDAGGGTVGSMAPCLGDISTAQITAVASGGEWTTYRVTFANAMADTNYFVRFSCESSGTLSADSNILTPVFKIFSTNQFDFSIWQGGAGGVQNVKVHCEVVQLS